MSVSGSTRSKRVLIQPYEDTTLLRRSLRISSSPSPSANLRSVSDRTPTPGRNKQLLNRAVTPEFSAINHIHAHPPNTPCSVTKQQHRDFCKDLGQIFEDDGDVDPKTFSSSSPKKFFQRFSTLLNLLSRVDHFKKWCLKHKSMFFWSLLGVILSTLVLWHIVLCETYPDILHKMNIICLTEGFLTQVFSVPFALVARYLQTFRSALIALPDLLLSKNEDLLTSSVEFDYNHLIKRLLNDEQFLHILEKSSRKKSEIYTKRLLAQQQKLMRQDRDLYEAKFNSLLLKYRKTILEVTDEIEQIKTKVNATLEQSDAVNLDLKNSLIDIDSKFSSLDQELISQEEFTVRLNDLRRELSWTKPSLVIQNQTMTDVDVDGIVAKALQTYDADKTGMFDFALESAGGSIVSTKCTETYSNSVAVYSILGIPFWWRRNTARTILQPSVAPGQCWPFKGSSGSVVVRLSAKIDVTAVTIEHVPRMLGPDGLMSHSAPRSFEILGLLNENDLGDGILLGSFEYQDSMKALQTFYINSNATFFSLIELKILSNYGHQDYTCLYRFRVHGIPEFV